VVGKIASAAAPQALPGGKPATTLWWDGPAIAKNATDAQAEAAFKVILAGLSPEMMAAHSNDVIWLIKGYKAGRLFEGAIASLESGAPAYPVTTQMGLIHSAIGNNISDYFTGKATAQEVLAKAEDAYATAAKEAGLLK
jgi:ABC-type glycerol-3-phosphate transport system substrate-binding protein